MTRLYYFWCNGHSTYEMPYGRLGQFRREQNPNYSLLNFFFEINLSINPCGLVEFDTYIFIISAGE